MSWETTSRRKITYSVAELRRFRIEDRVVPTRGLGDLFIAVEFDARPLHPSKQRRRRRGKKKLKKEKMGSRVAEAQETLPTNLIEGPFQTKSKSKSSKSSQPVLLGSAAFDQTKEDGRNLQSKNESVEHDDIWEDVPEHELAGLLCRSALNRLLPGNIDAICHGLMHNQSISQAKTILAIVNTIVTQVVGTRVLPFGKTFSQSNAVAVSSLRTYALFATRFLRMAPTLHLPSTSRTTTATDAVGVIRASVETVTAGELLEQALMSALMSLLDRVGQYGGRLVAGITGDGESGALHVAAQVSRFGNLTESAFCLSYFLARLHEYGSFRTATLHVILTMLIDENEIFGDTGAPFELWLGSLMLEHIRDMDLLVHGVQPCIKETTRAATMKGAKSKAQVQAAQTAVAHYFEVLSRAKEKTDWLLARFAVQQAWSLTRHGEDL